MQTNKSWTRQKLTEMLYHAFIGSLADNVIEIGWILCFSLLADKNLVERITVLFGVNDAFWVVLSSTYYAARTSMTATLPKLIEKQGLHVESKIVKNHIYLFYIMLLPSAIGSFMFLPKLLLILGVSPTDLPFYIPYFQLSILSILIAAIMLTEPFKKIGQLVTIYDEQTKSLSVHGPNGCKFVRKENKYETTFRSISRKNA